MKIVYFSTRSGNTKRFVDKLGYETVEIPVKGCVETDEYFILITPTYGSGDYAKAVPPQVIRFLNNKANRDNMVAVVSTGNINFGNSFGIAGAVIAKKCGVPWLGTVEVFGTPEDVKDVKSEIEHLKSERKEN